MPARKALLKLTRNAYGSSIEIDGQDIPAVRAVRVTADIDTGTELELELVVHEIEVDGEAQVQIPNETRAALVALGWTPPPDQPPANPA